MRATDTRPVSQLSEHPTHRLAERHTIQRGKCAVQRYRLSNWYAVLLHPRVGLESRRPASNADPNDRPRQTALNDELAQRARTHQTGFVAGYPAQRAIHRNTPAIAAPGVGLLERHCPDIRDDTLRLAHETSDRALRDAPPRA